jgi:hypothetical protein
MLKELRRLMAVKLLGWSLALVGDDASNEMLEEYGRLSLAFAKL